MGWPAEALSLEPFTQCASSAKASHEGFPILQQWTGDINCVAFADSTHVWRRWIPSKASSSHANGSGLNCTVYG